MTLHPLYPCSRPVGRASVRSERKGYTLLALYSLQGHTKLLHTTLTITAPLHLPDAVQGVSNEVWEAPVEVH